MTHVSFMLDTLSYHSHSGSLFSDQFILKKYSFVIVSDNENNNDVWRGVGCVYCGGVWGCVWGVWVGVCVYVMRCICLYVCGVDRGGVCGEVCWEVCVCVWMLGCVCGVW